MLTVFVALTSALCSHAGSADDTDFRNELAGIGQALLRIECFNDSCNYEVLLPSAVEPVQYNLTMMCTPSAAGDSLAPCNYYIKWQLAGANEGNAGFSAYFDNSHFRFRDSRLQEYHFSDNPEVFAPNGDAAKGVQQQAQFVSMLPHFVGAEFLRMATDNECSFTISKQNGNINIKGTQRAHGYDVRRFLYVLHAETLYPVKIDFDNNPGQISEQEISVEFATPLAQPDDCRINLESLIAAEPVAFEKFRTDSYSLESLKGRFLPAISLKDIRGRRWTHDVGAPMDAPTIIVLLSTEVGSTGDVMQAIRRGADSLPFRTDLVWIFIEQPDAINNAGFSARPGETLLVKGGSAARDLGSGAITPVLIFVNSEGKVIDFVKGYNQDMLSVVIEKTAIMANE